MEKLLLVERGRLRSAAKDVSRTAEPLDLALGFGHFLLQPIDPRQQALLHVIVLVDCAGRQSLAIGFTQAIGDIGREFPVLG